MIGISGIRPPFFKQVQENTGQMQVQDGLYFGEQHILVVGLQLAQFPSSFASDTMARLSKVLFMNFIQ